MTEEEIQAVAERDRFREESGELYPRNVYIHFPPQAVEDTGRDGLKLDIGELLHRKAEVISAEQPASAEAFRFVADTYYGDDDEDYDADGDGDCSQDGDDGVPAEYGGRSEQMREYLEISRNAFMGADTLIRVVLPLSVATETGRVPIFVRLANVLHVKAKNYEELGMTIHAENLREIADTYFSGPKGSKRIIYDLTLEECSASNRHEIEIAPVLVDMQS